MAENTETSLGMQPRDLALERTERIALALYLWAIVGGLLPAVLNRYLEGADAYHLTLMQFTSAKFLCWLLAGAVFSLLAAHISSPKTLIQAILIGMSAPAVLGGMVAQNQAAKQESSQRFMLHNGETQLRELPLPEQGAARVPAGGGSARHDAAPAWEFHLISPALADAGKQALGKHRAAVRESTLGNVFSESGDGWYVFVASTTDQQAADQAALQLRQRGIDARVFQPYGENRYFGVTVGSNLALGEAKRALAQAKRDINAGAYVWRAPADGPTPVVQLPGRH